MIEITEEAKSKIKEIYDQNPGKYMRVVVEGDGCAGPYFRLFLDEADTDEKTIEVDGIEILVSDAVQRYAKVTMISIFMNQIRES